MDNTELARKVDATDGLTSEEKAHIKALLLRQKNYGLIWEDKHEAVEERLRENLPVLREVEDKAIISDDHDAPNHILIEGDNLEALATLAYTHAGKIDVIYIDPPYNTGNKDFVYNDKYVDREDAYKHSKWLSFMSKRLVIAKQLLSEKGVIFISIDDNEQAQLKLLCDEVFGEENFVINIAWRRTDNQPNIGNVARIKEYILCYANNKTKLVFGKIKLSAKAKKEYRYSDEKGLFRRSILLHKTRGRKYYQKKTISGNILNGPWMVTEEEFDRMDKAGEIYWTTKGEEQPYGKIYLKDSKGQIPNDFWGIEFGTNQRASLELEAIFNKRLFDFPKPTLLINNLLSFGSFKSSTILDFFAGSGTTLHATMLLNAEDGGHRQCILVTNNENNICEEVTYERNRRVIKGYTTPRGVAVAGLSANNLRYYKTSFVSRARTLKNMHALMDLSTDMLCIRNDVYTRALLGGKKIDERLVRFFDDGKKQMLIIYDEGVIPHLIPLISSTPLIGGAAITTYVFSPDRYTHEIDFNDVRSKVSVCPLPQAIYDTYRRILPCGKKRYLRAAIAKMQETMNESKQ